MHADGPTVAQMFPCSERYGKEPNGLGSLMDYNAREYSPLLGRFLSADTIVPNPGSSQSLNRYSYVENSPMKYYDPSGHAPSCAAMGEWAGALSECNAPRPAQVFQVDLHNYNKRNQYEYPYGQITVD